MTTKPTGLEPWTPVDLKDTSATERAGFRRCRRQWFLGVVHRLGTEAGNTNFWLGTMVHKGLEAYYRAVQANQDPATAHAHDPEEIALDAYWTHYDETIGPIAESYGFLWANALPMYQELGTLGEGMLGGYFEKERLHPSGWEVVEVERRFRVPIRNPKGRRVGWLTLQLDLVVRVAADGHTAGVDHKTASRDHSSAQLDLDDQLTCYVWGYEEATGVALDEMIYNVLMKKVAGPPKRNKDKKDGTPTLSKDKGQATTFELYLAEIKRLGLDVNDYSEHLAWLRDEVPDYFHREGVFRTSGQKASFAANLYEEWRDMRAVAAHPERAYPNPSPFNCPSCQVKPICQAMMDQTDAEYVVREQFVILDPRR